MFLNMLYTGKRKIINRTNINLQKKFTVYKYVQLNEWQYYWALTFI